MAKRKPPRRKQPTKRRKAASAPALRIAPPDSDRRFEAQQIAYDAMEAWDNGQAERALDLAGQALAIDDSCVDALMLVAQAGSETPEELLGHLTRAVDRGAAAFGPQYFEENRGYFWGLIETRPYMRARSQVAKLLAELGRLDESIAHHEEMLELCPNDNLGLRYPLLGIYLEAGRREAALRLLARYEDDGAAMFAWARVLLCLLADDEDGALEALQEARAANPHAEALLSGRKRRPRKELGYYTPGEESEAIVCFDCLGRAWKKHSEAKAWLEDQRQ
jgi:tetratricopeptide (TPR) repeat protein